MHSAHFFGELTLNLKKLLQKIIHILLLSQTALLFKGTGTTTFIIWGRLAVWHTFPLLYNPQTDLLFSLVHR